MASDPTPGTDPVERAGDIRSLAEMLARIPTVPRHHLAGCPEKLARTLMEKANQVAGDRAEQIRRAAFLAAVMTVGRKLDVPLPGGGEIKGSHQSILAAAADFETFLRGPVAVTGGDAKAEAKPMNHVELQS